MANIILKLQDVKRKREDRPKKCRYCERQTFQRWGSVPKPVKDVRVRTVRVYRYRCCHCRRTFRYYPEGVCRADQTERLKQFAAICWRLSLSHRAYEACPELVEGMRARTVRGYKTWQGMHNGLLIAGTTGD